MMRRINFLSFILISFLISFLIKVGYAGQTLRCGVAFYYHGIPPALAYNRFDYIVVDPDAAIFCKPSHKYIAYLSVGEIDPHRPYYNQTKPEWIIGFNEDWGSHIADVTNAEYLNFLMSIVDNLYSKGFRGLFLDTLDSYQRVVDEKDYSRYANSIGNFIKSIKAKYPDMLIFTNRGFEFIDESFRGIIDVVVAEDLYSSYDFEKKAYGDAQPEQTEWLLQELNHVKEVLGVPIVVIEYTNNYKKARDYVKKILRLGFIPYVADIDLSVIGIGKCNSRFIKIKSPQKSECTVGERVKYCVSLIPPNGIVPAVCGRCEFIIQNDTLQIIPSYDCPRYEVLKCELATGETFVINNMNCKPIMPLLKK